MPTSIDSQLTAMRTIAELRPEQIVRAGLCPRPAQAELLRTQLVDAYNTFRHVASDERIRRYVEKLNRQ